MSYKKELSLNEIQDSSFDILTKVVDICEERELDYFLMYGTLLGAVRHGDIIPWDDDIDIMMPRKDYEELLDYFSKHKEDLYPMALFNNRVEASYPYMISRISNVEYEIDTEAEDDCGMGTFVDIFPLDYIGDNVLFVYIKSMLFGGLSSLYFWSGRKYFTRNMAGLRGYLHGIMYVASRFIGQKFLRALFNEDKLIERQDKKGRYWGPLIWMTAGFSRNIFDVSVLKGRARVTFRGVDMSVPACSDRVLTQFYGDYKTLPPLDEQTPHHLYKAYKK